MLVGDIVVGDIAQKNKLGFKYTKVCNYSYVLLDASLIFSQILYHVQNETVHFTEFRDFDLIGQLYAFHRTWSIQLTMLHEGTDADLEIKHFGLWFNVYNRGIPQTHHNSLF